MPTDYLTTDTELTSIANAIRTKGGTSASLTYPADFVSAINAIPTGGGGGVEEKDVNFYDYEGTCLYSYTKAEFANLSAMPANPSHDGLTSKGWNWTLADAKTYVSKYGGLDIGQMYSTTDGKTHIHIEIEPGTESRKMYVNYKQSIANDVTVDWGDGNSETFSGTGFTSRGHYYANPGKYIIKLSTSSGTLSIGANSSSTSIYGGTSNCLNRSRVKGVAFGDNTILGPYAFRNCDALEWLIIPYTATETPSNLINTCISLKYITIPNSVTTIRSSSIYFCYHLELVSLPKNVTSIEASVFFSDYRLKRIWLPASLTTLGGNNVFNSCQLLSQAIIPVNVTSAGGSVFSNCYALCNIHLYPTSPPSIGAGIFSNTDFAICEIYVPYSEDHSILNDYKTATNWSSYASYMVEEPQ